MKTQVTKCLVIPRNSNRAHYFVPATYVFPVSFGLFGSFPHASWRKL